MALCPTCRKPVEASASFCSSCGARLESGDGAEATLSGVTAESPAGRRGAASEGKHRTPASGTPGPGGHAGSLSSSSLDGGRFAPGEMVAGRYRIVSRLGRGGMGEVYRADDVTLGQPVALKFLPAGFAADADKVQRLLHEVRLTRQISHPNVCRVYDAVTLPAPYPGGAPTVFLAMEYIDGEDLASLLRRIGRLPGDKALEVARQVCAGLAAAHDLGVIHRDLKPSNIMLDGRGRARLTDFGVAGTAAEIAASGEVASGTPTYMAPEQLNGQDVSVRSDIYSLGLLLYELFTGKAVFRASSMAELRGLHATKTPERPSAVVPELDPLVERVILRCLEKDPAFRPSSALAVSASLPGGDPLAAALAAGETPTPEMVAASGGAGASSARFVLTCLGVFLAGTLVLLGLKSYSGMVKRTPFDYSTEVLRSKAVEFVKSHAPPPARRDEACGFSTNWAALREIETNLTSKERWASLMTGRPSGILFWYRYAPHALVPVENAQSVPGPMDPPMAARGSALVWLDALGRLIEFRAIPEVAQRPVDPLAPAPRPERAEPDWDAFFAAAGLERSKFTPAEPRMTAPFVTDRRLGWTGVLPTDPPFSPIPVRVEAASFEGRPVLFTLLASWHTAPGAWSPSVVTRSGQMVQTVVDIALLVAAPLLAWRHARTGRGDRRGAFCLAVFLFATTMGMHLLRLAEPLRLPYVLIGSNALARSAWWALFGWMLYMALEPYIRRIAPWAIVGWARMMQGRLTDALVGRDMLVGAVLAVGFSVVIHVSAMVPMWFGASPPAPQSPNWNWFGGARWTLSTMLQGASNAVFVPMYATIVMVGMRWLLRSDRRALIGLWVVGTGLFATEFGFLAHGLLLSAVVALAYSFALVRFGLLTMATTFLVSFLINGVPANLDLGTWYTANWLVPYGLAAGLACFAGYTSLGGRAGAAALLSAARS